MEFSQLVMWLGFALASYSVVGNDVIQTLGTFLTSNEKRMPWYVLWGFAVSILLFALINGYLMDDIDYGRLDKFNPPATYAWYYLLPPIVLLLITRSGIPVSTTFMILTLFSLQNIPGDLNAMTASIFDTSTKLGGMIHKSLIGYLIAFSSALVIYLTISRILEQYFIRNRLPEQRRIYWIVAQWFTTGFLWYQWLTQDLANIYIYLNAGQNLNLTSFIISLLILTGLLGYIFYSKGGAVQNVVRSKVNTADIRSATFIDLIYGIILYIFKYNSLGLFEGKLPMSTTWVFVGLLAGRELGIRLLMDGKFDLRIGKLILLDFFKIFMGLVISVVLVFIIKLLAQ